MFSEPSKYTTQLDHNPPATDTAEPERLKFMSLTPFVSPPLILASTSPYRRELLARLRLPFDVVAPNVDETARPDESPEHLALRLAREKAEAVAQAHPGKVVIGSDQVAVCDGRVLGKPGSFERAFEQLRMMAGQITQFHTAVAVTNGTRTQVEEVVTRCQLRPLADTEIEWYLRVEAPFDTAGSAKVEGLGITLMDRIESDDPTALIGLPLIATTRLLIAFGVNPLRLTGGREA